MIECTTCRKEIPPHVAGGYCECLNKSHNTKLRFAKEEIAELIKCNQAFDAQNRALRKNLEDAAWKDWKGEMSAVAPTTARIMRDWHPVPELAWHNVGVSNWRATWNNIPIAGYCDEPSEHRDGVYVMWGNTIFTSRIATAEEARAAINAKFIEWLTLAASVFLGGGGAEQVGDGNGESQSRAASPSAGDERQPPRPVRPIGGQP